jgi:hypothetical protein
VWPELLLEIVVFCLRIEEKTVVYDTKSLSVAVCERSLPNDFVQVVLGPKNLVQHGPDEVVHIWTDVHIDAASLMKQFPEQSRSLVKPLQI